MLYAIVGMLVIIADQYVKFWVMGHITLTGSEPLIPGIVSLVNVHNDGAAFGFLAGSGARIPFIILAGVFTVAVIIALATNLISGKLARWSIIMVTAGGLSNCLDRVLYGYVQDMFKLEFIDFPVFNLADVFITVFAVVFALAVIFGKTRKDEDEEEDFLEDEEEEEKPVSRRKQKRMSRKARKQQEEEDDEEEEEEPIPAPKKARGRRGRKQQAEEEEEVLPAPKRASKKSAAAAPSKATAAAGAEEEEDPFAAWERANARVKAVKDRQSAVVQAAAKPAAKSAAPARETSARPAAQAKPAASAKPAAAATAKPASKPAAKPAAKPAPKPAEEEFSLDDILNEFR